MLLFMGTDPEPEKVKLWYVGYDGLGIGIGCCDIAGIKFDGPYIIMATEQRAIEILNTLQIDVGFLKNLTVAGAEEYRKTVEVFNGCITWIGNDQERFWSLDDYDRMLNIITNKGD